MRTNSNINNNSKQSQDNNNHQLQYPTTYYNSGNSYGTVNNNNNNNNHQSHKPGDPLSSFWAQKRTYGTVGGQASLETGGSSGPGGGKQLEQSNGNKVSVGDIIGDFGLFQLIVLLFSGLREGCAGYDALVTSVVTQPERRFVCRDGLSESQLLEVSSSLGKQLAPSGNNTTQWAQCYRQDAATIGEPCQSWLFLQDKASVDLPMKASLVTEWGLVCGRSWWVAFAESSYFFGLVLGNLIWGYYADRLGRRKAYLISHTVGLVAGLAAVFMPNVGLFSLCRFFAALGNIGYNIIYSIQVELIGSKYRSLSTVMNHLGWGLGVMCVPFVGYLTNSARVMLAVAPLLTLLMFPWAFWLPESPRWLLVNGRFQSAKKHLLRAARYNGQICDQKREEMIKWLKEQVIDDKLKFDTKNAPPQPPPIASAATATTADYYQIETRTNKMHQNPQPPASSKSTYRLLFENHLRDTLILSFASFLGHLFFYLLTINFGDTKNLSTEANFIISGLGEWVCVVLGAVLLKLLSRKNLMSLCLLLMACSFAFQSLIDSNLVPEMNNVILVTTNNAVGTLSGLLLVFVVLIVNQEVYPTVIRQTGASIANTLGESGSTIAPWLIYLNRMIGLWRADLICMGTCLLSIVSVQFLTKTDNVELTDV